MELRPRKNKKAEDKKKMAARMRVYRARKKEAEVMVSLPVEMQVGSRTSATVAILPGPPGLGAHPIVPHMNFGHMCAECGEELYESGGLWKICTVYHRMWGSDQCIRRNPYVCKFCMRTKKVK